MLVYFLFPLTIGSQPRTSGDPKTAHPTEAIADVGLIPVSFKQRLLETLTLHSLPPEWRQSTTSGKQREKGVLASTEVSHQPREPRHHPVLRCTNIFTDL